MKTSSIARDNNSVSVGIQSPTGESYRILVVDDDPYVRELNAETLISSGFVVDTAEDGAAGWNALHTNQYDLLITDNSMPKVSGVELVGKLRAAGMELPVIMATGALPAQELRRDRRHQPAVTLLKPFKPDQLLEAVRLVLRGTGSACDQIESRQAPGEGR